MTVTDGYGLDVATTWQWILTTEMVSQDGVDEPRGRFFAKNPAYFYLLVYNRMRGSSEIA